MPALVAIHSGKDIPPGSRAAASRGFTLIELMITISILGILIAFALPSFTDFVRDQRVKTATTDVYSSLIFARSEAIKRNANVHIEPTNANDWAAGWRVRDAGGINLKIQDAIGGVKVTGLGGAAIAAFDYRGDGRLSTGVTIFVVSSPDNTAITARCVRIDPSGRPNIKADTNKNVADGCQ